MTAFFQFPHTPHLAWLGPGRPRDDKVLSPQKVRDLLSHEIVVEEKVDGANLGFSVDGHGMLRAQSRGSYLDLDAPQGQWKPLRRWLSARRQSLMETLSPDRMLFGEWCYAVHSVRYTRLPDWFLAFDVYDTAAGEFWSADRRDALAAEIGVAVVPCIGKGHFDLMRLRAMLDRSVLADGPPEGLYLRREIAGRLRSRAKLVRAEFTQSLGEHWSKRALEANQLAATALDAPGAARRR